MLIATPRHILHIVNNNGLFVSEYCPFTLLPSSVRSFKQIDGKLTEVEIPQPLYIQAVALMIETLENVRCLTEASK